MREYRVNQRKSLVRAQRSVRQLNKYFEGFKIPQITTPKIQDYIETRQNEGAANATINRELSALKCMLNMGARQTPPKVDRVPYIPMLKENNTRKGFFEHGDYLALRDALPDYLQGFVAFAYKTGWRLSEIEDLTWAQVDRDQGRTVYLDQELKEIFTQAWEARKKGSMVLPYVFLNHKGDDKIKQFNKAWATACQDAGIGKRLFHDFRRTAVRNMVRAGIPERVAMMVSGHKTRSIFERYNIVNDTDLKMAAQRQEKYLKKQNKHKTATIVNLQEKRANRYVG